MKTKLLSQMVQQFKDRHGQLPEEIIIHPVALAALAIKQSLAPKWNGIPVICRDSCGFPVAPTGGEGNTKLGVTVIDGVLRGFDL